MAIESGIGATLSIDDGAGSAQAIGTDVSDVNMEITRADLQVPGLANTAMSRVSGLVDFQFSGSGWFNDDANMWFDVTKTVGSSVLNRTIAFALSGNTLSTEDQLLSVTYVRSRDGGMQINCSAALADGATPTWA
jgi:hypothetical protein